MHRVLIAGFYVGIAIVVVAFLLMGDFSPFALMPFAATGAAVAATCGVGMLVYAIFVRSSAAWGHLAVATLVAGAAYGGTFPLSDGVAYVRFLAKRERLDALVRDVLADGRVQEMSDATRHYKELNDAMLRDVGPPGDTAGPSTAIPLREALVRQGIDEATYRRFRAGLLETGYISFTVTDDYIAFVKDGMLDNLHGIVYVRPGHAPPPLEGEFVDGTQLVTLHHLDGPWYRFGTT